MSGNCVTHSDEVFKRGQKEQKSLFQRTGGKGYYDSGIILGDDGNQIGTYERTYIDREYALAYGVADGFERKAPVVGAAIVGAAGAGACIGAPALCPAVSRVVKEVTKKILQRKQFKNLDGLRRGQAQQQLRKEGFQNKGNTEGGYEKWSHPDGSKIQIRPNGEIIRTPSKQALDAAGKSGKGWRVDGEGNVVRPHTYKPETIK